MTPRDLTILQTLLWLLDAAMNTCSSPNARSSIKECIGKLELAMGEELGQ